MASKPRHHLVSFRTLQGGVEKRAYHATRSAALRLARNVSICAEIISCVECDEATYRRHLNQETNRKH